MGYAEIVTEDTVIDLDAQQRRRHAVIAGGLPYILVVLDPERGAALSWFGIDADAEVIAAALVEIGGHMQAGTVITPESQDAKEAAL